MGGKTCTQTVRSGNQALLLRLKVGGQEWHGLHQCAKVPPNPNQTPHMLTLFNRVTFCCCCTFCLLFRFSASVKCNQVHSVTGMQSKTSTITHKPFKVNMTDLAEPVVHYHSLFELASVFSGGGVQPMCNVFPNSFLCFIPLL